MDFEFEEREVSAADGHLMTVRHVRMVGDARAQVAELAGCGASGTHLAM